MLRDCVGGLTTTLGHSSVLRFGTPTEHRNLAWLGRIAPFFITFVRVKDLSIGVTVHVSLQS